MRTTTLFAVACLGCGPMYRQPAQAAPPPPAPTAPTEPSASDPPPDPYADAEPARAPAPKPRKAPDGEAQAFVDAHNGYRAQHCAAPLTWSPALARVAQQWANSLRDQGCKFGHSNGKYGENLAAGTSGTLDANAVVAMWYDEIKHYDFSRGGFSMQTGHFTQVVWKGTTQVGCGRSQCNGMDIWVCEYDPPGNWEGQYRENVAPRGCR